MGKYKISSRIMLSEIALWTMAAHGLGYKIIETGYTNALAKFGSKLIRA
jgi:hypothetical protein